MGDLLFSSKTDIAQLTKAFKKLRQIKPKSGFGQYSLLVMSKVNPAKKKYTRNPEKVGKSRKIEHGT
jgi:hypothetical protein